MPREALLDDDEIEVADSVHVSGPTHEVFVHRSGSSEHAIGNCPFDAYTRGADMIIRFDIIILFFAHSFFQTPEVIVHRSGSTEHAFDRCFPHNSLTVFLK